MGWTDGYKTYDPEKEGYGSSFDWKRSFYKRMNKDEAYAFIGEEDPWTILGIPQFSSKSKIKKAYRDLAKKYHPDKNDHDTTEIMQKINAAYWALI